MFPDEFWDHIKEREAALVRDVTRHQGKWADAWEKTARLAEAAKVEWREPTVPTAEAKRTWVTGFEGLREVASVKWMDAVPLPSIEITVEGFNPELLDLFYGKTKEDCTIMPQFETKDSGARAEFANGGVRDTQEGKPRFDLIQPETVPYADQILTRFAALMGRGAEKYEDRNWEQFSDEEALQRAYSSAFRHFVQWFNGEVDEDHAAAVFFNIMAAEYVRGVLDGRWPARTAPKKTDPLDDLKARLSA
jgi:hypothetical protein